MNCTDKYLEIYKKEADAVSFCPYRICPLGAHVDHQLGKITGMAINAGVRIAYGAKQNGVVELSSLQFDKRAQWHVSSVPEARQNDWADYLRGATLALAERYTIRVGLSGVIEGSLPIGGLSSSAAVVISFMKALCDVNSIKLEESEAVQIALTAENKYVGVSCGKLDQSCEIYCKKNKLLYMDLLDDSYELIAEPESMKPYKIAIFFSGIERNLTGTAYNMRVDECRSAAYALKAFSGMEYGKFKETQLRDIPREVYDAYSQRLPEPWRLRADHYFSEMERVERGVDAWRRGSIEDFGKLCFESGHSSIHNWQTGLPELIRLYELMRNTEGIYGGRFSGAGIKGCCMAIIDPSYEEKIIETISKKYLADFPYLRDKYSAHICESADGISL